jgi:hypothetical protein
MGFRWTRTAQIANGKFQEAIAWSKEIAGYCEKKYNTGTIHTYVNALGPVGTIRWTVDYATLAEFERVQTAMLTDQDYWKYINKATTNTLFIDGRTEDTLSREV